MSLAACRDSEWRHDLVVVVATLTLASPSCAGGLARGAEAGTATPTVNSAVTARQALESARTELVAGYPRGSVSAILGYAGMTVDGKSTVWAVDVVAPEPITQRWADTMLSLNRGKLSVISSAPTAPNPTMQPILSLDSSAPVPFVDSADAARIAARAMPVPPVEFDQAVLQTLDGRLVWLLGSMHPQRMTILLDGLSGAVLANPSTVPLCGSPGPASAASPVPCSRSP